MLEETSGKASGGCNDCMFLGGVSNDLDDLLDGAELVAKSEVMPLTSAAKGVPLMRASVTLRLRWMLIMGLLILCPMTMKL